MVFTGEIAQPGTGTGESTFLSERNGSESVEKVAIILMMLYRSSWGCSSGTQPVDQASYFLESAL